jgi:lipopolysaccharide/colanic/teichoic acid biosynthesis glycosyltransferase
MFNKSKAMLFLLSDVFILLLVLLITSMVIFFSGHENPMTGTERGFYYVFSSMLLLTCFIEGLYSLETLDPTLMPVSLIRSSTFALGLSLVVWSILSFADDLGFPLFILINSLILPYLIHTSRSKILSVLSHDSLAKEAVLIGAEETLKLAQTEVTKKPYLGFRIKGIGTPDQLNLENLTGPSKLLVIERALFGHPAVQESIKAHDLKVIDIAYFTESVSGKIPLNSINEEWILEHSNKRNSLIYNFLKELLDRTTALVLIIVLAPGALMLLPILLIVHGPPLFFTQQRTGLANRPFTLYKVRTMVKNAEVKGAQWSTPGDARITALGKWLRKTRIDELPQLLNILKGEMSLVGPRPESPSIIARDLEPNIPYYRLRHLVRPGVTGWAQVTFRYGFTREDSKEKLQYDLFYIKNRDIWMDIIIIIKTIKIVITGAGQ